jgi:DNA-binding response OmpR family regulator
MTATASTQKLTDQGFVVLKANSGEAALPIVRSHPIDVLFTEVLVPGELDGWRLAAKAWEARPELSIIYTMALPRAGGRVPGSVLLEKPYWPSALAEIIRNLTTRRRS